MQNSTEIHKKTQNIANLKELDDFAKKLASQLKAGDVLALNGPMGAGKTTLTQQLGKHLGLDEKITSPTFVLIHDYLSGETPLIHVDLYRLGEEEANSLAPELLDVLEERSAIIIVEWAKYGDFLQPYITLKIDLDHVSNTTNNNADSENQRQIEVKSYRAELTL